MRVNTHDVNDHPGPPPRASRHWCEHNRLRPVWRVFAGGVRVKRYGFQCLDCGTSGYKVANGNFISQWVGARKCLDYMGYQPHEAVPYEDEHTLALKQRANEYWAEQRSPEMRAARRDAWWDWYDDYLHSGAWQAKRQEVLERDGGKCVQCGGQAHAVHHLSYASVGFEPLSDLVAICTDCHNAIHQRGAAA